MKSFSGGGGSFFRFDLTKIVIILFLIIFGRRIITSWFVKPEPDRGILDSLLGSGYGSGNRLEDNNKLLEAVPVDYGSLSITEFQAQSIADSQFHVMNGLTFPWAVGESIKAPLRNLNPDDLRLIFKKFGQRSGEILWLVPTETGNLFEWYRNEMALKGDEELWEIWSYTGLTVK